MNVITDRQVAELLHHSGHTVLTEGVEGVGGGGVGGWRGEVHSPGSEQGLSRKRKKNNHPTKVQLYHLMSLSGQLDKWQ